MGRLMNEHMLHPVITAGPGNEDERKQQSKRKARGRDSQAEQEL